jgi:hypothetical protein
MLSAQMTRPRLQEGPFQEELVLNRDQKKVVMPKLGDIISSIAFPVQTVTEDVIYGGRNEGYLRKVSAEVRRYTR